MEEKAFYEKLYLRFSRLMYASARKYTENREDAEDVVQSAMERLLGRYDTLSALSENALAAYIIYTVRSVAINRSKQPAEPGAFSDDELPGEESAEEAVMDRLLVEQLAKSWRLLPEKDRLLSQRYMLGCSTEELARYYGCSMVSIRVRLHRARKKARELLSENELKGEEPV